MKILIKNKDKINWNKLGVCVVGSHFKKSIRNFKSTMN